MKAIFVHKVMAIGLIMSLVTFIYLWMAFLFRSRYEEGGVKDALQAGPRLIRDGIISVDPEHEGFQDSKILTQSGARSAVGVTSDHRLILLTTPGATIPELAEIMLQTGAIDAMNLDGGASSGMYYDGSYLTRRVDNSAMLCL